MVAECGRPNRESLYNYNCQLCPFPKQPLGFLLGDEDSVKVLMTCKLSDYGCFIYGITESTIPKYVQRKEIS